MKEIKMIKALDHIIIHSIFLIIKSLFPEKYKMQRARIIIRTEQIIGANTGLIHVTGIRNRMSHVKNDSGQFKNNFRAM